MKFPVSNYIIHVFKALCNASNYLYDLDCGALQSAVNSPTFEKRGSRFLRHIA